MLHRTMKVIRDNGDRLTEDTFGTLKQSVQTI